MPVTNRSRSARVSRSRIANEIQAIDKSVDSGAIVTAMVTLGHAMRLRVTAEGVETADQEKFLRRAGCSESQGYRYAHAVPSADLVQSLDDFVRRAAAA